MKNIVIVLVSMVIGAVVFGLASPLIYWSPSKKTDPITFMVGDKKVPVLQLTNEGIMIVNIPEVYKQWQAQKKEEVKK